MAKVTGLLELEGTVGNISIYKTKSGYVARQKGGPSGKRIKSDPKFARTRENMAEFARATQGGLLFRRAFSSLVRYVGEGHVTGRLTAAMLKVIRGDTLNNRGQRTVESGDLSHLENFQLNATQALSSVLFTHFTSSFNRSSGEMIVDIPAFDPSRLISIAGHATHFRLRAATGALDFENHKYDVAESECAFLPIRVTEVGPIRLIQKIQPGATKPLFQVLALELGQLSNGVYTPLRGASTNAGAIVKIER